MSTVVNHRFKALRLARRLTQAELAALVCDEVERTAGHRPAVDGQAISRIERGEIKWPSGATRRALKVLLRAESDDALGLYPKRTRHDTEREKATKRRNFLALSAVGLIDPIPKRIGNPDLEWIRDRFGRFRDLDAHLGGADTFRLYFDEMSRTEQLLQHKSYTPPLRTALTELAAEQAQQAGWAAFDAGRTDISLRLYEYSYRTANEADNEELKANALIHIAYATQTPQAIDAADAACAAIHNAPAKARALLESRRAWSRAIIGDAYGAEQALDTAREALASTSDREPDWCKWVDEAELDVMTGRVWAVLHDHRRAIEPLDKVLRTYPDHWSRDKALYLTWLAEAHLDAGNHDQAVSAIENAMNLASRVASVRPVTRLKSLAERMSSLKTMESIDLTARIAAITPKIPARL